MKRWLGACCGLLAALLLGACQRQHVGPPPDAPRLLRPFSAMPADLDCVVRLDLQRMRDTLGAPAMQAIGERAMLGLRGADSATDELLLHALATTNTLWIGFRPSRDLEPKDSVFVLSGHFADFDPGRANSTPPFEPALDLGADLRRYDRARPAARSAVARIYAHGDDWIVSLSQAEIDSVERAIEEQRGAPALEPAEKGALSAVARPRALPVELFAGFQALQHIAERADRLELTADLTGAGVDAELGLKFEDESAAEQVGRALEELRNALNQGSGRLAKFAARVRVSSAAQYVTLRLSVGRDEFSELVNCRGSACAW